MKGLSEDEMVGWHHPLNGHEFEQAPGDGEEQGSLECCSPWGCKELVTTERLNNNKRTAVRNVDKRIPEPSLVTSVSTHCLPHNS